MPRPMHALAVFLSAVLLPAEKMHLEMGIPDPRNTRMFNWGRRTLSVRDSRGPSKVGHGSIREVQSC
jgi:hypothetical protein